MSNFYNNSIFWIEVEKVKPNPYQPRREFDEARLRDLADSIRQYGVLQPLVVTRKEVEKPDGGLAVEYELIAGERRLRASKLAGIAQVPVLIRSTEDDAKTKLELAIIENLQREDLNAVDRAKAFARLVEEFGFKHAQIAQKIGKSREYVSNTVRILTLPEEILQALSEGKISEGHTRPLMMLDTRKEEQITLFKEIVFKKMTVREAERIARRVAHDRARKVEEVTPEMLDIEEKLAETLGTRVQIERKPVGGKLIIDFFSERDLESILNLVKGNKKDPNEMLNNYIAGKVAAKEPVSGAALEESSKNVPVSEEISPGTDSAEILDDRSIEEKKDDEEDEDLYNEIGRAH
ncbi:MAG: ParB/RepB/Spo0J family partition protein, partial [Candidatus Paceibacterota bacterium]